MGYAIILIFWTIFYGIISNFILTFIITIVSYFKNGKLNFIKYLLYSSLYILLYSIIFSILFISAKSVQLWSIWGAALFFIGVIVTNTLTFNQFKNSGPNY